MLSSSHAGDSIALPLKCTARLGVAVLLPAGYAHLPASPGEVATGEWMSTVSFLTSLSILPCRAAAVALRAWILSDLLRATVEIPEGADLDAGGGCALFLRPLVEKNICYNKITEN